MKAATTIGILLSAFCATSCFASRPEKPAERAAERLQKALTAQAPGQPIDTRSEPGPLDTTVVTAVVRDAYPGSGVFRVVLDAKGHSYGAHGERNLAELARARGWLARPPSVEALVKLVSAAQFEGLLMLDDASAPKLERRDGGLALELVRRRMPSGAREQVEVRFPKQGDLAVSVADAAPTPTKAAGAADPIAVAERALAPGSKAGAAEKSAAIATLRGRSDARSLAALAHATTDADEDTAAEAMMAMGAGDSSSAALRDAWKDLPAARRMHLIEMASEAYGAAFAATLR